MQGIVHAYNSLIYGMRHAAGVLVFCVFVLIVTDVFVRILGVQPWGYSVMVVEYALLWFAMLAAPYLVRIKGHVFIDALTTLLSPVVRNILAKFAYLICIVSSLIFTWYSLQVLITAIADGTLDVRAEDIPLWVLIVPMPFSFTLVAIEFSRYLIGIDTMYSDRTESRDGV